MAVLDSIVRRMRAVVEKAYSNRERFVHLVKEGADELQESIANLFCTPRLHRPMWLSMVASPSGREHSTLARTFLNDLCFLLSSLDTKSAHLYVNKFIQNNIL